MQYSGGEGENKALPYMRVHRTQDDRLWKALGKAQGRPRWEMRPSIVKLFQLIQRNRKLERQPIIRRYRDRYDILFSFILESYLFI